VEGERVVQISDLAAEIGPRPMRLDPSRSTSAFWPGDARTLLSVALRKDEVLLGLIVAGRKEVRHFGKQIAALLQNSLHRR